MKQHIIDAQGEIFGRLATRIAIILLGKHKKDYAPNLDMADDVIVKNVDKLKFTGKKLDNKIYYRFTGYPGGIRKKKMRDIFETSPDKLLKDAVYHMLPDNRLKKPRIKHLKFE